MKELEQKLKELNKNIGVDCTEFWMSHGRRNEPCFTHSYMKEVQAEICSILKLAKEETR